MKIRLFGCAAAAVASALVASGPAWGQDFRDKFPKIEVNSPYGVNLQSGQLSLSDVDMAIGPFSVVRQYSQRYSNPGPAVVTPADVHPDHPIFSIGSNLRGLMYWREFSGGGPQFVIYVHVEGQVLEFHYTYQGAIRQWNTASKGWRLYPSGSDYYLVNSSGDSYRFITHSAIGPSNGALSPRLLASVQKPDGARLDYTYSSAGELTSVASNLGYRLNFVRSGSQFTLCGYNLSATFATETSGCSGAQSQVGYSFGTSGSSDGKIVAVTRIDGTVVNYQYNANRLLSCETLPNSSTCRITNQYWPFNSPTGEISVGNSLDQVTRQTTATGEVWNYEYDFSAYAGDAPPLSPQDLTQENKRYTTGRMTDPLGNHTIAYFLVGYPEYVISPAGRVDYDHSGTRIGVVQVGSYPSTPFVFTNFALVPTGIKYPEGDILRFVYDGIGNNTQQIQIPKPGSSEPTVTISKAYPVALPFGTWDQTQLCYNLPQTLCDKPTSQTNALGHTTTYTYDATHGGVLTETGPAVNGIQPQTRYTYVQRTAMVKDSGGGFVASSAPVWLIASKSFCKTGAASGAGCAIAGDEVVTTYDYGPTTGANNLLLRGMVEDATGTMPVRTCYAYDAVGNRISETRPAPGTVCP